MVRRSGSVEKILSCLRTELFAFSFHLHSIFFSLEYSFHFYQSGAFFSAQHASGSLFARYCFRIKKSSIFVTDRFRALYLLNRLEHVSNRARTVREYLTYKKQCGSEVVFLIRNRNISAKRRGFKGKAIGLLSFQVNH